MEKAGSSAGPKGLKVRTTQCATCIYRPDSALASSLDALEAEAADPAMPGHFALWRACHTTRYDTADVVCAGFYERHRDRCTLLQLASRLGGIVQVDA